MAKHSNDIKQYLTSNDGSTSFPFLVQLIKGAGVPLYSHTIIRTEFCRMPMVCPITAFIVVGRLRNTFPVPFIIFGDSARYFIIQYMLDNCCKKQRVKAVCGSFSHQKTISWLIPPGLNITHHSYSRGLLGVCCP